MQNYCLSVALAEAAPAAAISEERLQIAN